MIGGIIGDIIGSVYEHQFKLNGSTLPLMTEEMSFTDDTIHMLALAEALMEGMNSSTDYARKLKLFYEYYSNPKGAYGKRFSSWVNTRSLNPYFSLGNGCLMRLAPILWLDIRLSERLILAVTSSSATHDHPESLIAVSCMTSVGDNLRDAFKKDLAIFIKGLGTANRFGYEIKNVRDYFGTEEFDFAAATTLPKAIACVMYADSFEAVMRNAISIGGDVDTIACIAGTLAEFVFPIPEEFKQFALAKLDDRLRNIYTKFMNSPLALKR